MSITLVEKVGVSPSSLYVPLIKAYGKIARLYAVFIIRKLSLLSEVLLLYIIPASLSLSL